jgi:hypothetical protein
MVYLGVGAVDHAVKIAGEQIEIFVTAHDTSTKTKVRAEIVPVDSTDFNLMKAGLRPFLDLVANVPHDTSVSRGYAVKHNGDWYDVSRIEDEKTHAGVVASRRLILVRVSPGGLDMRS